MCATALGPHLVRHAQGVLEQLESLLQWREGEAEALRFHLVPRRTDPEPGATTGQHVERRGGLDPEAGGAVVDPADHESQARPLAVRRHEAERGLALEHRRLWRPVAADLEEMVHDPDRVEAGIIGGPHDPREGRADGSRTAGPGELVDLESELHRDMVPRAQWLLRAGAPTPRTADGDGQAEAIPCRCMATDSSSAAMRLRPARLAR